MADPALAYALLKATFDDNIRNPVDAVVPIIKRALFRYGNKSINNIDLQRRILEVWGLEIPISVIQYCLPKLRSQEIIYFDIVYKQYRLTDPFYKDEGIVEAEDYARSAYDRTLANIERILIDLEITNMSAADVVVGWIDSSSLSFLGGVNPPKSADKDDWMINQIIVRGLKFYDFKDILAQDLTNIALGDSLYRAVRSLTEFNTDEIDEYDLKRRMDAVDVYLDTQIIIQAFGYAREELNQAADELLEMCCLTGCQLKVFRHTVDELSRIIRNSIDTLAQSWIHSERTSGYDIVAYARENGLETKDLISIVASIPRKLSDLKIKIVESPSVLENIQLSVDERKLIDDLKRDLGQSERARNTDVDSITAIYRLRGGKAHKYLERCRAIFITSNKGLSDVATRFFQNHFRDGQDRNIVQHVMTSVVFATRLWPKIPTAQIEISKKQIIAHAVSNLVPSKAAQAAFIKEIKTLILSGQISETEAIAIEISRHLEECIYLQMGGKSGQRVTEGQALEIIERVRELDMDFFARQKISNDNEYANTIRGLKIEIEQLEARRGALREEKGTSPPAQNREDAHVVLKPKARSGHLVILVHGINTFAHWMDNIAPVLEGAEFKVTKTGYGVISPLRFLAPTRFFQKRAIKRVVDDIRAGDRLHHPKEISAIAHSFGTFVLAQIIRDYPEFEWSRIIFCGSVVKADFDFNSLAENARFRPPLVNEVGLDDWWPIFAEKAGLYYGSIGANGIKGACVETRWHKYVTHSEFLTEKFCRKYWIPFLKGGHKTRANPAQQPSTFVRAITAFPYKVIVVPLYIIAFVGVPAVALVYAVRLALRQLM